MKKRKLNYRNLFILILIFILILALIIGVISLLISLLFSNGSVNGEAKKYHKGNCVLYYPDNKDNLTKVVSLCDEYEGEEKVTYDYSSQKEGDYYRISYENGISYYLDKDYKDPSIVNISDKAQLMIFDYLRYQMKKDNREEGFSTDFVQKTYQASLKDYSVSFAFRNEDLIVSFPEFECDVNIPLEVISHELGMDFGKKEQPYIRPHFVDPDRKMIAFTFDDGPNYDYSSRLISLFDEYDGCGTFFVIGNKLGEKALSVINDGVQRGMVYGSHTSDHVYLTDIPVEQVYDQIEDVGKYIKEKTGYQISLYRPPYGARNELVDAKAPYTAVLWNVDSLDWSNRQQYDEIEAVNISIENVKEKADDKDIVLFHDAYSISVSALEELLPYYVSQGYQIVSVEELLAAMGKTGVPYFFGG